MDAFFIARNVAVVIVAFFNLFLGELVLARNPRHFANRIFFLIEFFFFLWCFSLFFYENPFIFGSLFWIRITYVFVSCFVALTLYFSFVFPINIYRRLWVAGGLFGIAYILITIWLVYFTQLMVINVEYDTANRLQAILGSGYLGWTGLTWVVLLWSVVNFVKKDKLVTPVQRVQMHYFWLGFIIFAFAVCIPDVFIPIFFKDTSYFFISTLCSIIFSGSVAYIMLKHRFLDFRLIVARLVAYASLLITLFVMYGAVFFLISASFFYTIEWEFLGFSTILMLAAAVTFQPVRMFFEQTAEALLSKENYIVDVVLKEISEVLVSSISVNELALRVSPILKKSLNVDHVMIIAKRYGDVTYFTDGLKQVFFKVTSADLLQLEQSRKTLVFEEMEEGLVKQILRKYEISVFLPLHVQHTFIGAMILGPKRSGRIYYEKDIRMLEIMSSELAVAIQNAQNYEEIRNFNVRLSNEVNTATKDLRDVNERLKSLDKLKDEFVGVASHELRSPMTVIQGYIWRVLHDKEEELSDKNRDRLERAYRSTRRLIALISDILDVSRIEAGRMETVFEPVELQPFIADIIEEMKVKSSEKGVNLLLQAQPITTNTDRNKLRQVFVNLVDNAIKFTPKTGTVTITISGDNEKVVIAIADTGVGIRPQDMSRLFTKFGKLDNTLSLGTEYIGTGLGLYLSKKLVEDLLHGSIVATSVWGKGTTFTITLPNKHNATSLTAKRGFATV